MSAHWRCNGQWYSFFSTRCDKKILEFRPEPNELNLFLVLCDVRTNIYTLLGSVFPFESTTISADRSITFLSTQDDLRRAHIVKRSAS